MTRTLHADMRTAVAAATGEAVVLLLLDFPDGAVRLSTGTQNLSWDSQTWVACGGIVGYDGLAESGDLSSPGAAIRVSGVNAASVLSILLTNAYIGREATLWLAFLNPSTGAVTADPLKLFRGWMNGGASIEESAPDRGGGNVDITIHCADRVAMLNQSRGIQGNVGSHQLVSPGDMFFKFVGSMRNVDLHWGG